MYKRQDVIRVRDFHLILVALTVRSRLCAVAGFRGDRLGKDILLVKMCIRDRPMVMDTLRAAVRHLAAAPLDHTRRRLPGQWDCLVRAEDVYKRQSPA